MPGLTLSRVFSVSDNARYNICNLSSQKWWNCVAHLMELLRSVSEKEIVVREGLQSGGFADSQASALSGIIMNKVVTVLGDMAGYRRGGNARSLYTKTVAELSSLPVFMVWFESWQVEVMVAFGRVLICLGKGRSVNVSTQIGAHVSSCFMIEPILEPRIVQPVIEVSACHAIPCVLFENT